MTKYNFTNNRPNTYLALSHGGTVVPLVIVITLFQIDQPNINHTPTGKWLTTQLSIWVHCATNLDFL